jgi:hypothetical protein
MPATFLLIPLTLQSSFPRDAGCHLSSCRERQMYLSKYYSESLSAGLPLWSSGQSSWLHNGDVLCFLWGTNSIYVCYVEESRLPLWPSGQSSWLHNGDVSCFLWGTNWIYVCYVEESRPPLWSSGQSSWLQNRDVLCFLWVTNWIYICHVEESRLILWSSGQSSWLQNGDVLCFLWGTNWICICHVEESRPTLWPSGSEIRVRFLALSDFLRSSRSGTGSTQLFGRNSSGCGLEIGEYGRRDPSRWPLDILYPQKLALSSSTSGDRLVDIFRSVTKATEIILRR